MNNTGGRGVEVAHAIGDFTCPAREKLPPNRLSVVKDIVERSKFTIFHHYTADLRQRAHPYQNNRREI